jgi:hypothetical protein
MSAYGQSRNDGKLQLHLPGLADEIDAKAPWGQRAHRAYLNAVEVFARPKTACPRHSRKQTPGLASGTSALCQERKIVRLRKQSMSLSQR